MKPTGVKEKKSLKEPWDDCRRKRFLAVLELYGWTRLGKDRLDVDFYQLGGTRLAVDWHGLFVFTRANGRWVRRCGLADNLVDANVLMTRSNCLQPLYLNGNSQPYELDLRNGRMKRSASG
ncbi:MAG: hypothetical protein QME75_10630 [Deltaproteobacteria bacterium]|nr:hypothetical protein [Deltaproteobacteria bacterium]